MTKIINLQAENIKKIKAIEIVPKGNTVLLTGKNAQGKTTILDCIWWALNGKANIQSKPIRDGEDRGIIRLEFDDFIVTREFRIKDNDELTSKLTVENKDGCVFKSPQSMLDDLLGSLSFDPLAFINMKPREQFAELMKVINVDVDLDGMKIYKDEQYEKRTEVNRDIKQLRGELAGIAFPIDTPDEQLNTAKLYEELQRIQKNNEEYSQLERRRTNISAEIIDFQERIAKLKKEQESIDESLKSKSLVNEEKVTEIENTISLSSEINTNVLQKNRKRQIEEILKTKEETSAKYTNLIQKCEDKKRDVLSKTKMPVEGLSLGDSEVLYNGLPIDQISGAEQLRVSCAIAMSGNTKLKVLRIKQGSNLDSDSLNLLSQIANDKDYQIWIEKVDESGKLGIVIEDGGIKTTNY